MKKDIMTVVFCFLLIMTCGAAAMAEDIVIEGENLETTVVLDQTAGTVSFDSGSGDVTIQGDFTDTDVTLDSSLGTISLDSGSSGDITIQGEGLDASEVLDTSSGAVTFDSGTIDVTVQEGNIDTTGIEAPSTGTVSVADTGAGITALGEETGTAVPLDTAGATISVTSTESIEVSEKKDIEHRSETAKAILQEKGIKLMPAMASADGNKVLKPKENK